MHTHNYIKQAGLALTIALGPSLLEAQALPPGQSSRAEHLGRGRGETGVEEVEAHIGVVANVINPLDVNRDPEDQGTVPWFSITTEEIDKETNKPVTVITYYPLGL